MPAWRLRQALIVLVGSGCVAQAAVWTQPPAAPAPAPAAKQEHSAGSKVDPRINAPFQKPRVKDYVARFESEDREVYARRREIVATLELKPGMAVADIGAGTGLFTRLFADAVGPTGKVFAVDISQEFLGHIAAEARKRGQPWIQTIQGNQQTTNLAAGSVDAVFLCDVYHHLEKHQQVLASIHRALRPGGLLVVVEFDRVEGKSTPFVLNHIRASQREFRREIEMAGFNPTPLLDGPKLKENFIARFRKAAGQKDKDVEARGKTVSGAHL